MKIKIDENLANSVLNLRENAHHTKVTQELQEIFQKKVETLIEQDLSDGAIRELRGECRALKAILELPETAERTLHRS